MLAREFFMKRFKLNFHVESARCRRCHCKAPIRQITIEVTRARQNGDHSDHRSRKVLIFDGKFYLNFTRFCIHFDGKRVFVTETNILLLTI